MKTVLITGATGNIGKKLRAYLSTTGKYELRLLCLNPDRDPAVMTADLSLYDEGWAGRFEGVDTVVHMAADPSPWANWTRIRQLNLDLMLNVMAASHLNGVKRVVFASSNYVVAGYRFRKEPLTSEMAPWPINPYGSSKLFGERVGKMFAERYGVTFIAFRIGVSQRLHDNKHGPWVPFGRWGQNMWLSDRDLCRAFEAAIDNESVRFGVYNLTSNNPGMRWDLDNLRQDLGFEPEDGETAQVTMGHRFRSVCAWLRDAGLPALGTRLAGRRW